jgi:hypothetical protein
MRNIEGRMEPHQLTKINETEREEVVASEQLEDY